MHFTPPFLREILQWTAVISMVAVFGVCQDAASTPDRINHIYEVEQSTGQIVSERSTRCRYHRAVTGFTLGNVR